MKILLDEAELRLMARVKDFIGRISIDQDGYIEKDELIGTLWDLTDEYEYLYEKFEQLEKEVKENYKPCDVNDNWRYYSKTIDRLEQECSKLNDFIKEKGLEEEYGRS